MSKKTDVNRAIDDFCDTLSRAEDQAKKNKSVTVRADTKATHDRGLPQSVIDRLDDLDQLFIAPDAVRD